MIELSREQLRRYKYAAGYLIEQEGSSTVTELTGNEKMKYGVRESEAPGRKVESLSRQDAEKVLRKKKWTFYGYQKIEALTVPAKIFDSHVAFSKNFAFETAQTTLAQEQFEVEENGKLGRLTRKAIEEIRPQNFFGRYTSILVEELKERYGNRKALIRRANQLPYRNVETTPV